MFWRKKVLSFGDSVSVEVRDVAAAQRWYSEKLGLPYSSTDVEEASMVLGYSKDDADLYLTEIPQSADAKKQSSRPPIIFASKLEAAHEFLSSRGVELGPVQADSGGNRFFRFHDLEGNELEVCQQT